MRQAAAAHARPPKRQRTAAAPADAGTGRTAQPCTLHDVLLHVFGYLDAKPLSVASQVCRAWKSAADRPSLWVSLLAAYGWKCAVWSGAGPKYVFAEKWLVHSLLHGFVQDVLLHLPKRGDATAASSLLIPLLASPTLVSCQVLTFQSRTMVLESIHGCIVARCAPGSSGGRWSSAETLYLLGAGWTKARLRTVPSSMLAGGFDVYQRTPAFADASARCRMLRQHTAASRARDASPILGDGTKRKCVLLDAAFDGPAHLSAYPEQDLFTKHWNAGSSQSSIPHIVTEILDVFVEGFGVRAASLDRFRCSWTGT